MSRVPSFSHFISSGYETMGLKKAITSGFIVSGSLSHVADFICHRCKIAVGNYGHGAWSPYINAHGKMFCHTCCNYNQETQTFITKEEIGESVLRAGANFNDDTPRSVIANWYDDRGLPLLADYLRNIDKYPVNSSK